MRFRLFRASSEVRRAKRQERRRKVQKAGVDVAPAIAGAAGAVGGTLAVGAAGGLVAPVASGTARRFLSWSGLGKAFQSAGEQFGERERARAQRAFETAVLGIAEALDDGQTLRNDGFFDTPGGEVNQASPAIEIFEGVLRAACETHEQRKAERLGKLYVYFAKREDVSPAHANRLLQLARSLTYQQLVLLGLFSVMPDGLPDIEPTGTFTVAEIGLTKSIADLARLGLVVRKDNAVVSGWAQVNPAQMRTVLDGKLLVDAMSLTEAEQEDLDDIATALRLLGKVDADAKETSLHVVVPPGSPADQRRVEIGKTLVTFDHRRVSLKDLPPESVAD